MVKTNILFYYIDALGEQELSEAINRGRAFASSSKIISVTNPILRFLMTTTQIKGRSLHADFRQKQVSPYDYAMFNLVGGVLKYVADDVKSNPAYRAELINGLVSVNAGPALAQINELTTAGYYRFTGYEISIYSSQQKGHPDIDVIDTEYASDTKLFPNERLRMRATINECAKEIEACFTVAGNGELVVHLRNPDKKIFKSSLAKLKKELQKGSFRSYHDEGIHAISMHEGYQGGDVTINFIPNKLTVHFQASWPMDQPLDALKLSLSKSVKQAGVLKKTAITWVMFPEDAGRHAMELQMMRYVAGFHQFVEDTEGLDAVVLYSLEPNDNNGAPGMSYAVDVYGNAAQNVGISKASVSNYLEEIFKLKEVILP